MKYLEIFKEAKDFETSKQALLETSTRTAWRIAAISLGVTVLSWVALVLMLPLKTVEPYVIRVDRSTGVPDIVTRLSEEEVSFDETLNKYFLATYVTARETYNWHTLQNDYDKTRLFSSIDVGKDYQKLFEGEEALDKKFKDNFKAQVHIQSIVPNEDGRTGTVRFSKTIRRTDDANSKLDTQWVATLSFEYATAEEMLESERLINPLGFRVTSYRVDPEMIGGAN